MQNHNSQSGNILFMILLAIVLIGALTAVLQGTSSQNNAITSEKLTLNFTAIQNYGSEMERGINFIMQNGKSESDIRFAHPSAPSDYGDLSADSDPSDQLFHRFGGNVQYKTPPTGINDGSLWEFYGQSNLPHVGSSAADLIAVLPNVTPPFCDHVNKTVGYTSQPRDSSACINSSTSNRFSDSTQFSSSPNTVTVSSFSVKPSMSGCVECTSDGSLHYFRVLMAR